MSKLLLITTILFISFTSFSQVKKIQAVIVFTDNDTLSVEIKDEQLQKVQIGIQYRKLDSQNFITGFPSQVKSVRFADGRLFESIKIDSATFLLFNLVKGYYGLYAKLENSGLKTYYLRHAQDELIHLTETFTEKVINGQSRMVSNHEYAHQLTTAMSDNV
jgi:hypothetical protein